MRPRGTTRWAMAFVVVLVMYALGFPSLYAAAAIRGGAWGIGAVLVVAGFGLALVFSAVYDGPRAVVRLLRRPRHQ